MDSRRRTMLAGIAASLLALAACGTAPPSGKGPVVLVAGATGGTGVEIVRQAQARGYAVRALVRDENKGRELLGDGVRYYVGDVREPESLEAAFRGADFVVSALGSSSRRDPQNRPELIDYAGVKALAELAKEHDVKQFVLVSAMGVTDPANPLNELDQLMTWKLRGEESVRSTGVDYTIVRPGALTDAPAGSNGIRLLQGDRAEDRATVARADVASACVAALGNRAAVDKTFEIVGAGSATPVEWNEAFAALAADAAAN